MLAEPSVALKVFKQKQNKVSFKRRKYLLVTTVHKAQGKNKASGEIFADALVITQDHRHNFS